MLTLSRITRIIVMLIWAIGISVSGARADNMAAYSCQYATDLEQKQNLLESIREDAYRTERELQENIEKLVAAEERRTGYLTVDNIDLAQIVPSAEKITLAFIRTNSMLSPPQREDRIPYKRDSSTD